jgi:hypothetical protein
VQQAFVGIGMQAKGNGAGIGILRAAISSISAHEITSQKMRKFYMDLDVRIWLPSETEPVVAGKVLSDCQVPIVCTKDVAQTLNPVSEPVETGAPQQHVNPDSSASRRNASRS